MTDPHVYIAYKLRSTYPWNMRFPLWTIDQYMRVHNSGWSDDRQTCRIYYDQGANVDDVKHVAKHREPVNVAMQRRYDVRSFHENFKRPVKMGDRTIGKTSIGGYGELWEASRFGTQKLPPNIAIACRTPVQSTVEPDDKLDKDVTPESKRVWVISVVAYAFDSYEQPDALYFLHRKLPFPDDKLTEIKSKYGNIFKKIYYAAKDKGITHVAMNRFGCGWFSEYFTQGHDEPTKRPKELYENVWVEAFENTISYAQKAGVNKMSMLDWKPPGNGGTVNEQQSYNSAIEADYGRIKSACEEKDIEWGKFYENFPGDFVDEKNEKVLIVNAWDPWSIIGNGNYDDDSMDGKIGRASALAMLGWPYVNEMEPIEVPDSIE